MNKELFFRYWPVTMFIVAIFIANLLLFSFVTVQTIRPDTTNAIQETPFASPVPPETVMILNTGQEASSILTSIVSSWFLWVTLGTVMLFFLFLIMARSSGKNQTGE